jgi:hypothetical protein
VEGSCDTETQATVTVLLLLLFFIFVVLGLELRAYTLSHSTSPFSDGFFQDRIL